MSRIGVIAAMPQECEYFRQHLKVNVRPSDTTNSLYLNIKITHGCWAGHVVCLLESGIGKVNATLATEWLVREFEPDLIINTGSAGGIKANAQIGDFVLADRVCHHDVDVTPIGFKFGELAGLPIYYPIKKHWLESMDRVVKKNQMSPARFHVGTIASGESFIYQNEQVLQIQSRFEDVLACDMEAAAVAQVCHLHDVDCLIMRNLSDVAGESAPENFNQFLDQASSHSTALVLNFIQGIS